MAEFAGSAQALTWVNSAGTLNLAPHTRTFALGVAQTVIDATAGSDQFVQNLPSFVNYSPTASGVAQDGTSGTAFAQQLKAGVSGTLIYGPSGTVVGETKYTIPAFSMGLNLASPYADVTTWDVSWGIASGGSVAIGAY